MKKFLISMMLLAASATMSAQEHVDTLQAGVDVEIEVMIPRYYKKDPMTKQQGGKKWRSEHVGITEWDDGTVGMGLLDPPGTFVGGRSFGRSVPFNTCKVGIYTPDGELVLLAEKWKVVPGEGGQVLFFVRSTKAEDMRTGKKISVTGNDILNLLKETKGYVRYIADIYGSYNFDVSARLEL